MKKIILTLAIAFSTLLASAQFTVVSNITQPNEDESWEMSNFTENLGIGYQVNEKIMIGATKDGDSYNLFGRFAMGNFYAICELEEDTTTEMNFGVGYSIKFWEKIYIEPNYMFREDDGEFRVGLAYRF